MPQPEKTYLVHESFETFQGEGCHGGRAAFFVRLHGCPVHCPWCDSAGTWHPNHVPKDVERLSAQEIFNRKPVGLERVVITGGEPCIHDLNPLLEHFMSNGCVTALETCGAFKLPAAENIDWITVSPKWAKLPTREALRQAHELKIIVDSYEAIVAWENKLEEIMEHSLEVQQDLTGIDVWLHPEWSQRENPEILNAIVQAVRLKPRLYRAGWQLHKLYKADLLAEGSRKELVPLGGAGDQY